MHRAREVADGPIPRQRDSTSTDSETPRRPVSRDAPARSVDAAGDAAADAVAVTVAVADAIADAFADAFAPASSSDTSDTSVSAAMRGRSSSGAGATRATSPRANRSQVEFPGASSR